MPADDPMISDGFADCMSPLAKTFSTPQLRSAFQRLERLEDTVAQRHPNWDDLTEEEVIELLARAHDDELMPVLVAEGIFEFHGYDEEGRKIYYMSPTVVEAERRARGLPPETEQ
jgi:hypothetical protein